MNTDGLHRLLREAVRSRLIVQLALARQRVSEAGAEPMSLEEIEEEVDAVRVERLNAAAS